MSTYRSKLLALAAADTYALGGEGSGNFGHAGRPGEQGGSGPGGPGAVHFARNPRLRKFAHIPVVRGEGAGGGRHPEAEQHLGKVILYPKFDLLAPEVQDFVFAHEIGHAVLDEQGLSGLVSDAEALGIDVWDADALPFGQNNMHEAFADAFASYHTDKEVETRYPKWAKLVEYYAARTRDLSDTFDLVGNERSGNYGHKGRPGLVGGSAPAEAQFAEKLSKLRIARGQDVTPQLDFASQVVQFPKTGPPGTTVQRETIHGEQHWDGRKMHKDPDLHVDVVLHRDEDGKLRGIAYHYPQDIGPEAKGNVNIFVDPEARRQGIGTKLLKEADARFDINFGQQTFTKEGRKLIEGLRRKTLTPAQRAVAEQPVHVPKRSPRARKTVVRPVRGRETREYVDEGMAFRATYRERLRGYESVDLGGEGSGNFGHSGRPGEVGGSGPSTEGADQAPGPSERAWMREQDEGGSVAMQVAIERAGASASDDVESLLQRRAAVRAREAAAEKDATEWKKPDGGTVRLTVPQVIAPEVTHKIFGEDAELASIAEQMLSEMPGDVEVKFRTSYVDENGLTRATSSDKHNSVRMVVDREDGLLVMRTFTRRDGRLSVYHDLFEVPKSEQGKGTAKALLAKSYELYKKLGVSHVSTYAANDAGGYAWARFGFTAEEPRELSRHLMSRLESEVKLPRDARDAVMDVLAKYRNDRHLPWHVAGIVMADGRKVGKEILSGARWNAVLNMHDKTATDRLEHYLADRKKLDDDDEDETFNLEDRVRELAASILSLIGTETSGNYGHAGRPGQVGGSAPSGTRTTTAELVDDSGGGRVALRKATADDAERVAKLQVPPAYRDSAHISDDPKADLQATWTDEKGRTQYRYSAEHTAKAAAEKFERLKAFNKALPELRAQIAKDMHDESLSERERDAAIVMHLIDQTGFRPGSDGETGGDKKAYGATTLRAGHIQVKGDKISFRFPSKSGQTTAKTITNPALAKILGERKAAGGRLFKASEDDVLAYLKERAGDFKTKDFRTWNGTNHALKVMGKMAAPRNDKAFKAKQKEVADAVAKHLGNTRAVALKSYIDPSVWSSWKAKMKS